MINFKTIIEKIRIRGKETVMTLSSEEVVVKEIMLEGMGEEVSDEDIEAELVVNRDRYFSEFSEYKEVALSGVDAVEGSVGSDIVVDFVRCGERCGSGMVKVDVAAVQSAVVAKYEQVAALQGLKLVQLGVVEDAVGMEIEGEHRNAAKGGIKFNLLPWRERQRDQSRRSLLQQGVAACLLMIVGTVGVNGMLGSQVVEQRAQQASLQQVLNKLNEKEQADQQLAQEFQAQEQDRLRREQQQEWLVTVLAELTRMLPERVLLTSMKVGGEWNGRQSAEWNSKQSGEQILFSGKARNNAEVYEFVAILKGMVVMGDVEVDQLLLDHEDDGVSFRLMLRKS